MKTHIYLLKDGEHPHVCFVMLESNVYGFFTERSIDSFSQLDQYICIGRMIPGNDSNLLIVFYVQIMPDDFVMQLHRF